MTDAPTTRETADRETLVMQSIIDAHGQWEIENRNRKQGDGQLWQDGHVRLLAQAAIIAADHIGEANEKVSDDHAELARLAEAATKGEWWSDDDVISHQEVSREDERFIYAFTPAVCSALLSEIAALRGERDRLRNAASKSNEEVCQSLGKALGYPWFKDDQANFPGSTEEHGVCVGDHVAESIADEAARRLTQAERQRDELREAMPDLSSVIAWLANGCDPQHAVTELGIYKARIDKALANQGADQ